MKVELTICATCKFSALSAFDEKGQTGGEVLMDEVKRLAADRHSGVKLKTHECLWACNRSCTALIRQAGKTGYLAGGFTPDADAASALLDWADELDASIDGEVDFHRWPEGMKGHFMARLPDLGRDK